MRNFCCVVLALLPLSAFAYPIDVSKSIKGVSIEEIAKARRGSVPAGRFAKPEETAGVIAFLCSPAAGYVTGVSLAVDGGRMQSI